ncbi:hypothetical protein [Salana multivorans]
MPRERVVALGSWVRVEEAAQPVQVCGAGARACRLGLARLGADAVERTRPGARMVGGVGEMSLDDDADPVPGGRALGEGGETCGDGVLEARRAGP